MSRQFLLWAVCLLHIATIQGANETHYRGAVVEYAPTLRNVTENADRFIEFIAEAKAQEADIIVFPEMGLNGGGLCLEGMLTEVPNPQAKIAPCDFPESNYSVSLQRLSNAAKENSIYLIVNVAEVVPCGDDDPKCPGVRYYKYNTNVVFDRNGTVIARYRKFNLFGEYSTNRPEEAPLVFFDTDFGVRFGTFVCFDLMFEKPAWQLIKQMGITDIVFATYWYSELPFLTAVQAQQMWAYALDVNFLGSGYNEPGIGSGGSSIIRGRDGPLARTFPDTTTSQLLVADLPKQSFDRSYFIPKIDTPPAPIAAEEETLYLKQENLQAYKSAFLEELKESPEVCDDEFCCEFLVNFTAPAGEVQYRYRALVFNGVRTFDGVATGGIQACAIATCGNDTLESCGQRADMQHTFNYISISGSFNAKSALQMPSTLRRDGQVLPLLSDEFMFESSCEVEKCNITMTSTTSLSKILSFGVYSRNFARDGEAASIPATGDGTAHFVAYLALLLTFCCYFVR